MLEKEFITGLGGVQVVDILRVNKVTTINGRVTPNTETTCPRCQSRRFRIKATVERLVNHGMFSQRLIILRLKVPKLLCKQCGRYFMASVPGLLPWKQSTEEFRKEVFHLHQSGVTQKHLSRTHSLSASTVERWYQDFVGYRVKELEGRSCPIILGIDEHFFSRKKGYATTLVDLRNHKVFDVVLGKYEQDLKGFLEKLPGRDKVKVVVMDLSEHYRRLVKKYFPNAMIVADRFHVIRRVNHQFLNAWKQFDPQGRNDRGILTKMRTHEWNLKPEQAVALQDYFTKHPEMKAVYDFKQSLIQILLNQHINQQKAKDLIPQ